MEIALEDLRISVVDKFQELVAAIQSPRDYDDDDDDDDDETDIGRRVKAARSQLQLLKLEGRESRNKRREERKKLNYELYEQQRNLHRLGKKAQRHVSLYEYAVLMRDVRPARHAASSDRTETTERLIGKRPAGLEAPSSTNHDHNTPSSTTTSAQQSPPPLVSTLILRSQTFYGSSAFLWQLMVQTVLQVRLLRKCHLLTMFKAQEAIFKAHKNEEVTQLAVLVRSSDKMDDLCLDLMQRKVQIWQQMEETIQETKDLKEGLGEICRQQRRLMLKLKLREGQAVSGRVKENIEKRRSSTLIQDIHDAPVPFLAELKRESLKRLSTIAELRLSQDMSGPLVDKVRIEFSVDESLLQEEEEAAVAAARRSVADYHQIGRTTSSPQSHDTSDGIEETKAFGSSMSLGSAMMLEREEDHELHHHNIDDHASYVSSSTISDDSLDLNPEMVSPTTQKNNNKKKRSRAELKKSLDRLAQLNGSQRSMLANNNKDNSDNVSVKSAASRSELELRRLQAEQRLARSKRASKRLSMQAQREKAKERLEESKKRLQGFLATSSDDDNDDDNSISFSGHDDGDESGVIHAFSNFQEGESSTSLRSPDSVTNFPYASTSSLPEGTGNGN